MLLSGYTCDPKGGSESANTWYTALELAKAGAHVHLLTREADRQAVHRALDALTALAGDLQVTFLSDDVPVTALGRGQIGVYARYHFFQHRVRRWAQGRAFDVGHHVSWGSINHPVGLSGAARPLVIGPAGGGQALPRDLAAWVDGPRFPHRMRNVLLSGGIARLRGSARDVRRADLVLTANWETEEYVRRIGAHRTAPMVPDGVRELPPRTEPQRQQVVVWIGRMLSIKGVRLALESFRHALRSVPDARLLFVGDGPLAAELTSWSADLVEQGSVQLVGRLPWHQAQEILGCAKVHLFTGLRDSFSAQTLEAAAHGVPTVGLDQFGLRRFCHRSGFLLVSPLPGKSLPLRLGDALTEALRWPEGKWDVHSEGAREFALENTFAAHAQSMLDSYRALVESGNDSRKGSGSPTDGR